MPFRPQTLRVSVTVMELVLVGPSLAALTLTVRHLWPRQLCFVGVDGSAKSEETQSTLGTLTLAADTRSLSCEMDNTCLSSVQLQAPPTTPVRVLCEAGGRFPSGGGAGCGWHRGWGQHG